MPDFDTSVPHIARIYDYWLGGKDNFAADREAAELAMAATPTIAPGVQARVVYVDNDPIVLAHARALLTSATGPTAYLDADARDTGKILAGAGATIDFSQPVGVMLMAILHCVPDEDGPARIVASLLAACPPGSFLALSHPARDQVAIAVRAETSLTKSMGQKVTFRTRDQVAGFAAGLELAEPGVVPVQEWRPDSVRDLNSPPTAMWGLVARKA